MPGAVARSGTCPLRRQAAPSSSPTSGTFFRGDLVMKKFLQPFYPLPLIQEEQLSVIGERMSLSTGKLPRRLARYSVVRVTDRARNDLKCVEGP